MRVSGVDLGARKASVATYNIDTAGLVTLINVTSFLVHPSQRGHELAILSGMVTEVCKDDNYVFIEEPLVGRGVKASMMISQTAGAIMAALAGCGVQTEMVNVKTWKMQVCGNGNAAKHDVRLWLEQTYGAYADQCGEDQDAIDACCIGLFGVRTVRIAHDLADPRSVSEW